MKRSVKRVNIFSDYKNILDDYCRNLQFNAFPQVEASILLCSKITLDDVYLPISLTAQTDIDEFNIDEIIRRIDEKLAQFEALEAHNTADKGSDASVSSLSANNIPLSEHLASDHTLGHANTTKDTHNHQLQTEISENCPSRQGLRIFISAAPGSGKTTFCKRLTLAIINRDSKFFDKYTQENNLSFSHNSIPVFVSCKNVADISKSDLSNKSLWEILYKLNVLGLGNQISERLSQEDFITLFTKSQNKHSIIILDGWDEILDPDKADAFITLINNHITNNPLDDIVITSRSGYDNPISQQHYSDRFSIKELSAIEIKCFCDRWAKIIWKDNNPLYSSSNALAMQILRSNEIQIQKMRKNPLELSFLLTVSGNEGRLPDNKADLFSKLVDLYIYWSFDKSPHDLLLSSKTIRVLLAYTASYFSKHKLFSCSHKELKKIIEQCISDLEWVLPDDLSSISIDTLIHKLTQTSLLTITATRSYSFSGVDPISHRQLQEYLTAYAILEQYSDKADNEKTPAQIIADKYNIRQWKEIIVFLALMNDGRTRREIVDTLLSRTTDSSNDKYLYMDLLLELIVNGAEIHPNDKHRIYDLLFVKNITSKQVALIFFLLTNTKKCTLDFEEYIDKKFRESVDNNTSHYGYAKAIILIGKATAAGKNPFQYAEDLLTEDDKYKIVASTQMIIMLSWFKYADILQSIISYIPDGLKEYVNSWEITARTVDRIDNLLDHNSLGAFIFKAVRELIIAKYAYFSTFFTKEDVEYCHKKIGQEKEKEMCESILSLYPVYATHYNCGQASPQIRNKYLLLLDEQIQKQDYYNIIFTFCICAGLGCWSSSELQNKWDTIDSLYKNSSYDSDIEKYYYVYLKNEINNRIIDPQSNDRWTLKKKTKTSFVYSHNNERLIISVPANNISSDAQSVLTDSFSGSINTKNNLAYLLRRKEISAIDSMIDNHVTSLSPEQILQKGISCFDGFSSINYALSQSEISLNNIGNLLVGYNYLYSNKFSLLKANPDWQSPAFWWMMLALERHEFEGLVVLLWLYKLGVLTMSDYNIDTLQRLSACLDNIPHGQKKHFSRFHKDLMDTIATKTEE